jgi:hypothetical protein
MKGEDMADLIDRQSVIDLLKKSASRDIEEVVVTEKNIKLIMDMPKAFDVEKVVAELEELISVNREAKDGLFNRDDIARHIGAINAFDDAIDIVKRGGVE